MQREQRKDPKELIISNIDKHGGLPHWLGKEGYIGPNTKRKMVGRFLPARRFLQKV